MSMSKLTVSYLNHQLWSMKWWQLFWEARPELSLKTPGKEKGLLMLQDWRNGLRCWTQEGMSVGLVDIFMMKQRGTCCTQWQLVLPSSLYQMTGDVLPVVLQRPTSAARALKWLDLHRISNLGWVAILWHQARKASSSMEPYSSSLLSSSLDIFYNNHLLVYCEVAFFNWSHVPHK